jgi:hypothetical protein
MDLAGGYFAADEASWARLAQGLKGRNELTLEITLTPLRDDDAVAGPVLAFSGGRKSRNLALFQAGEKLVLVLTTSGPRGGRRSTIELATVKAGEALQLALTYEPGILRAYVNGQDRALEQAALGDFFPWKKRPLLFGAEVNGEERWHGTLEGVAIYSRVLAPEEVRTHARRYLEKLEARPGVEVQELQGRLLARSSIPTLRQISPYKDALVLFEYQVEGGERVRVAHWVLWKGELLPVAERQVGQLYALILEPWSRNPQVEGLFLSDTLEEDYLRPVFYDPSPLMPN